MFNFVIPIAFSLVTLFLTFAHLLSVYNECKKIVNEKLGKEIPNNKALPLSDSTLELEQNLPINQSLYVSQRLRSSVRLAMGRIRSREEYYLLEKTISYP